MRGGFPSWLLLMTAGSRIALAQGQATITGRVLTQQGRPMPSAMVTANPGARSVRSDSSGAFFLSLPADVDHQLLVAAEGMAITRISVRGLRVDETRDLVVVMRPLAQLEVRRVVASQARPLLNAENAVTGGSIEAPEISALPTDARDPIALLYNVPGITPATGFFGDAPRLSFNGGNALYSQYLLDGLDNNEGFLGGPRVEVPLGALARMDALVNTYTTGFGRSPDGVVNLSSLAGKDDVRADFYLYSRPGRPLDARLPVPFGAASSAIQRRQEGFRRTQAGGSWAGPLRRGTTYQSVVAEYTREDEDRIGSTALAQFLGTETRQTWRGLARLDHGWSPTQVTTLRLAASVVDRAGNGSGVVTPEADITTRRIGSLSALTHRSALRGLTASNTASLQFGTFRWYFPPVRSDFTQPQVTILNADLATEAVVGSSNFVFDETERQWQFRDVFEAALGDRHTMRTGVDVLRSGFRLRAASTNPLGAYVVVNEGNIPVPAGRAVSIRDVPANVRVLSYTIDARPQQVNLSQGLYGAFVEDTWRPATALTVNVGLRWDYDDLTSRGASEADLDNWQPRASFNWARSTRDVVRGGVGRYAGRFPYAIYSDAIQLGASGNAVLTYSGASAPAFRRGASPSQIGEAEIQRVPREVFELFPLGLEQPMSWQSTLGYQRQLGEGWGISADVVWSETRNLPWLADLNPIARRLTPGDSVPLTCASATSCPGDATRPRDPVAGGVRRISAAQSGGEARYVALYLTARRAMSAQWDLDANWTWSHAQNNTEDINFSATQGNCFSRDRVDAVTGLPCTSDEWADANNDRRHRLTLRSIRRWTGGLQWSAIVDAQTGVPVNRLAGSADASGAARYDLLGSGPIRGNSFIGNGDRFFGVARNSERLPGSLTASTSLAWERRVAGGSRITARADVFNLFNTLVWGGYANGIGGGGSRLQFGHPGDPTLLFAAAPGRQIQLSIQVARGG